MNKHKDIVWSDRKRNFLGLPWTFTRYQLRPNRLFIETGFLNSREAEIRLYRVTDMTLTRNLWQKIIGTGTIHCDSADPTMRDFDIKNIKNYMLATLYNAPITMNAYYKQKVNHDLYGYKQIT